MFVSVLIVVLAALSLQGRLSKVRHALDRERARIERIRKTLAKKDKTEAELIDALREVEGVVRRKKRKRRALLHNPDFRPHWSEAKKNERRDELADEIEDALALEDQTIEALDRVRDLSARGTEELERRKDRVARLRKRRERIEKELREGRGLSQNFSRAEFDCRDGTPVPDAALPALKAWCEQIGEPLRAKYGTVHVNSGYRTRTYNAAIGGASNSIHIYDEHPGAVAVDHTAAGASPARVADFEEDKADGLGRYATFTHADNRCRIGWPKSRWWG